MTAGMTRRDLLKVGAIAAGGLLAGCTPQIVKETVVVRETVEKVVKETVVVAGPDKATSLAGDLIWNASGAPAFPSNNS